MKQSALGLVVLTLAAFTSATPVKAQALQPPAAQPQVPQGQAPIGQPPMAQPIPGAMPMPGAQPVPGAMVPPPGPNNSAIQQFDQESYLLGPGDVVTVELFGQPDVTKPYRVLIDGTVSLPMVGNVPVRGLTLKQAAAAISTQYARYYRRPVVTVRLDSNRPITIGVAGQVVRPGTYIVGGDTNTGNPATNTNGVPRIPKVTFALQAAGGIQPMADVRNVQIRRPQVGRPDTIINVDLYRLAEQGDLSQDVMLRDGDSIMIPQATAFSPETYKVMSSATFAPATINVNVVGEVRRPGLNQMQPNSPLNNAILMAGGFVDGRANPNKVQLIRLNPDGTITQRELKVDLKAGLNPEANPTLQNNDVIVVSRSGMAAFSDRLGQVLAPFNGITGVVTGGLGRLILPVP
jgi:polysaccharide biosynthesis/export protein